MAHLNIIVFGDDGFVVIVVEVLTKLRSRRYFVVLEHKISFSAFGALTARPTIYWSGDLFYHVHKYTLLKCFSVSWFLLKQLPAVICHHWLLTLTTPDSQRIIYYLRCPNHDLTDARFIWRIYLYVNMLNKYLCMYLRVLRLSILLVGWWTMIHGRTIKFFVNNSQQRHHIFNINNSNYNIRVFKFDFFPKSSRLYFMIVVVLS